jgi:pimeloyl-ACP methyl ester carboxylesterase
VAFADANGIRLYYESHGRGPVLVLVSGTAESGEHWKLEQVPALSEHYRVIVFDHRGCGRSDRPDGPYSTRMFAADTRRLLGALGIDEPVHVLGHSMGGRVAQWFALDYPDVTRSLILYATGPGAVSGPTVRGGVPPHMVLRLMEYGWPGLKEEMHRGRECFYAPDPVLAERYIATQQGQFGTDLRSFIHHCIARHEHDTADRLDEIRAPSLVIVGAADEKPAQGHVTTSRYLADHLADAELVIIPEAAHALHVERPAPFNAAVRQFLAAH